MKFFDWGLWFENHNLAQKSKFKKFWLRAHTLLLQDLVMLCARVGWSSRITLSTTFNSFTGQWSTWHQCQTSTSLHSEQCQRQHSESNNTSAHAVASQWESSEMSYPSASIASVVCAKHARTLSSDFRKNSLEKHGTGDDYTGVSTCVWTSSSVV